MKRKPTYLYQVNNSQNYYFRVRLSVFSKKIGYDSPTSGHFVSSLKTSEYDDALWLSQFIFKRIIKEDVNMDNSTVQKHQLLNSQVKHLAYINSLIDLNETEFKLRLDALLKERFTYWLNKGTKMLKMGVIEGDTLQNLRTIKPEVLRQHYAQGEDAESHPSADAILVDVFSDESRQCGYSIDPRLLEAEMINRLIAELSKLGKKYGQFSPAMMVDSPEFDQSTDFEFANLASNLNEFRNFARKSERQVKARSLKHLRLATCVKHFKKSKFAENGNSSAQQFTTSLNLLLSIFGDDKLVTEFTGEDVIAFKNAVQDIDSGRKKKGVMQKLTPTTVNKYLSNIRQLFDWIKSQPQYLVDNPFEKTAIRVDAKKKNKRRKFESSEIQLLKEYMPQGKKEARRIINAAKWFVHIGLYSGMRLNEIASLSVSNIKSEEGIEYFDLTLFNGKTVNAPRLVPLHSQLIENGFLDYVNTMREQGEKMLFPELAMDSKTAERDGPGYQVGNWFNDTMLAKIGIDKKVEADNGIMIDFHCLRHTVVHCFKWQGADSYLVKQIIGHDLDKDMTWGVYSGKEATKLSALKYVIEKINY
jgi:integrase